MSTFHRTGPVRKPASKPKKNGLAWFLGLNGLFLLSAALLGIGLANPAGQGGLESLDAWMEAAGPWLAGLRLALSAALVMLWPQAVRFLAKQHGWPAPRTAFMRGLRWRVALWLLLAEGLLVHNGLAVLAQPIATP